MTNAELIAKIKAEIERRKGYISVTHFAEDLLSFLSTLESEKPMNQEELEEEYKDYVVNDPVYSKLVNRNAGLVIARHFAQWGAEHLANSNDEIVINGHKVAYNKDKDAITMEEIPNDLEEAARHSEILTYPMPEDGDIEKVFKVQEARVFHEIGFIAGAKWHKEQDEKEQADLFTIVALDAAQRAKEQMMKEAVEGMVEYDYSTGDTDYLRVLAEISSNQFDVKDGDKVRVIVLPKED